MNDRRPITSDGSGTRPLQDEDRAGGRPPATEAALQERDRQLREAQRIARLGSWTWDIVGNRVAWSDELYRIYGLAPQGFGASFEAYLACVHPDDRAPVRSHIERTLETGAPFDFEERIIRPDGEVRVLRSSGEVTHDPQGRPMRLVGVCRDITEMKAAEAALRASEESYRTVFELAGDAIFVHDVETGAILDANEKACDLYGCTLEELKVLGIGGISHGTPPFDAQQAEAYVRRAAEGMPQRFEWRIRRKTGVRIWVEVNLHRVRILGEPRVLASVRNINERKQAELALQEAHDALEQRVAARTADLDARTAELAQAEQRFRTIVEASPTPLLLSSLEDGTLLYANDRLEALLGAAPGSLPGQKTPDFYFDPADRPHVLNTIQQQGFVRDLELRIKRIDGTPRWVSLSVRHLTFEGAPALATALLDITERKRAEATLRLQKTLLEAQGEASIDGILVVSEEGKILSFNQRFVEMWSLPPEVVASRSDEAALQAVLDQLLDPTAFLAQVEYLYAHPQEKARDEIALLDGRILDRYSAPVISGESEYYGRIWFFRDVTAQKRHAEELEQARQEAEAAREQAHRYADSLECSLRDLRTAQDRLVQQEKLASLGHLTAGIAHEIKNPLNFVNNFAALSRELVEELREALAGGTGDPLELLADLEQNTSKIEEHGRRADAIIRSMMQHARGSKGRRETVDLNALVREYVALASHSTHPLRGLEIECDLAAEVGSLEILPQEMGRVLLNLLLNAIDAVQEQAEQQDGPFTPRITVSTRRAGEGIEIRVADNGTGISATVRDRIFEPFFTTKRAGSGTGLGLSLSYDIVAQGHAGTIHVESAEGKGSVFIVCLPVNTQEAALAANIERDA